MASFHHCIKSGKKGNAREHAAYIERHGRYENRGEDLIHSAYGNMPAWAASNPALFWRMADRHERANGAAYREHEIALPNELGIGQLVALTERIVRELVGNKPYQYAIHAPDGSLGAIPNPHVHLMYSDRMPDGIQREPERMFSRYNPKNPELGGCRKDSGGLSPLELRANVIHMRKTIADLQNKALADGGHETRVDHRSLREQGRERCPERHLGPARIRGMSTDEKAVYAVHRNGEP
ncbi:MAG: plasmid mobilization protein [Lysobacterales bacterium 14-68-21]|jgi:hypothetical protein|nr:MAG: plasmid mobilization protein [Xanthomonadales bacterium 14-68-21]